MERIPTRIAVVAAAIMDESGRFLLQKRAPLGRHAGLWEFPGGKVEAGENPENALIREIVEELALQIDVAGLVRAGTASEEGTDEFPAIVMNLYTATTWRGEPKASGGQEWGWFTLEGAGQLRMPEMDLQLLAELPNRGT